MSKEDYQKYIEQGIATRRNTYRGKELKLTTEFWNSIQNGTFNDIYVGDYIKSKTKDESGKEITWLVADIDNYLHSGDPELKQHHLTIIPTELLMNAKMNDTDTTKGGYYGSKMVSGCNGQYNSYNSMKSGNCTGSILEGVYTTYIKPDFGDEHVLTYSNLLTTQIDTEANNRRGTSNDKGASSGWDFIPNRKLDLMSEINVYGSIVTSSSLVDTGIDNMQYAIFQLKPEFMNINSQGKRYMYWLKDVSTSTNFALISAGKFSTDGKASSEYGVRPRFLIG